MPNYTQFQGPSLINDPTQKIIAQVLIKNELGSMSNGYQLDHAGTSNSGFSFGGNQMDIGTLSDGKARNSEARTIFESIVTNQFGEDFLNSKKILYARVIEQAPILLSIRYF